MFPKIPKYVSPDSGHRKIRTSPYKAHNKSMNTSNMDKKTRLYSRYEDPKANPFALKISIKCSDGIPSNEYTRLAKILSKYHPPVKLSSLERAINRLSKTGFSNTFISSSIPNSLLPQFPNTLPPHSAALPNTQFAIQPHQPFTHPPNIASLSASAGPGLGPQQNQGISIANVLSASNQSTPGNANLKMLMPISESSKTHARGNELERQNRKTTSAFPVPHVPAKSLFKSRVLRNVNRSFEQSETEANEAEAITLQERFNEERASSPVVIMDKGGKNNNVSDNSFLINPRQMSKIKAKLKDSQSREAEEISGGGSIYGRRLMEAQKGRKKYRMSRIVDEALSNDKKDMDFMLKNFSKDPIYAVSPNSSSSEEGELNPLERRRQKLHNMSNNNIFHFKVDAFNNKIKLKRTSSQEQELVRIWSEKKKTKPVLSAYIQKKVVLDRRTSIQVYYELLSTEKASQPKQAEPSLSKELTTDTSRDLIKLSSKISPKSIPK
jgi:hypothetical protein